MARNLLREDGVIFISIDDNEVHNLRLIMNEVFGEENFIASVIWQKKYAATNDVKGFSTMHDYIIVYQKSDNFTRLLLPRTEEQDKPYKNDDGDGKGLWRSDNLLAKSFSASGVFPIKNPDTEKDYYPPKGSCWRASQDTINKWLQEKRIFFGKEGNGAPQLKRYLNEVQQGRVPTTWWTFSEVGHNDAANKELKAIFGAKAPFETPKPSSLIKRMVTIASEENDIILDFFSGSCTTAHAVLDLNKDNGNRKFICVQLPEKCDEDSEAFKAGYKTIADIGKERIRRVIRKIKEEQKGKLALDGDAEKLDLGFKVFKLSESNFKIWRPKIENEEQLVEQLTFHTDPVDKNAEIDNILYELLLKSGVPPTAKIEEKKGYYWVNAGEIALILKEINRNIIKDVISKKPHKVITLDRLFKDNDQLKTNTALQMKDAGIEFKTG